MQNQENSSLKQKAKAIRQRSSCPVSSSLDILGDKWTLLLVRDLLIGLSRFGDFQMSPEKMPTNILAERLKRLEQVGVINKTAYQLHPVRYHYSLTEKGLALKPVLKAMMDWGSEHLENTLTVDQVMAYIEKRTGME